MKEILFRAWDKRLNRMYKVLSIKFDEPEWIYCENSLLERFNLKFDEVELMQFTGLLDKNGKKIFEGDVVRWVDLRNKSTGVSPVSFSEGCFCLEDADDLICPGLVEVIGNIYDNPELIKNTDD